MIPDRESMRIGLLTDSIGRGSPGIERYVLRLAEGLATLAPGRLTLFHRGGHGFYGDKDHVTLPRSLLPKQLTYPLRFRGRSLDVVHDTYHFPPFLSPAGYAKVMTIADLTPVLLKTHKLRNRLTHRFLMPLLARRADHVITLSEHTRRDVLRLLRLRPEKVTAVLLAAEDSFRPAPPDDVCALRTRYDLGGRFLLHVGTIEPRKNIPRLVSAFAAVAREIEDVDLVLAGPSGWGNQDLAALARERGLEGRVRFLGRVPEDDLPGLYSAATAFVYPSLYEGFGLPPLEAMGCGCPVVTSNVSSLPEVVGNAALLVDPSSEQDIASALRAVLDDDCLRGSLRARGLERAKLFSWRRCAEETMEVYKHVIASR